MKNSEAQEPNKSLNTLYQEINNSFYHICPSEFYT